ENELKQAISFESDKYIPFDPSDVVLDCQRLKSHSAGGDGEGATEGQMSVVLVACQKQVINKQLEDLVAHGLQPVAVDVDAFALASSYDLSHVTDEEQDDVAVALVDLGASLTQLNVMRSGETCFSREIGMGGADMTKATARRLGIESFEAEAIKRESGDREIEVGRAIAPVIEDLVSELSLSLDFVENREGVRVEEILLSGGSVLAPGLMQALESGTGRPARLWNPLDGLRIDEAHIDLDELEACASTLAVALGLASRAKKR
ncbi:MAG: type IV pilus assembly protein PilM, partial [Planctomycetota bacterium]